MKRLILLLSLILAFALLKAQDTYCFRTETPQGFSIECSTASELSLHYAVNEITLTEVTYGKTKGQQILLKGCFGSFAEGLPNLPFENCYIAVPRGAKVSIEVKEKASQTIQGIDLLPAAPLQINGEDKMPELRWESDVFSKDANFPTENVTIAQTTQIRGLDIVLLSVTPFHYNPVRKTLEVIYDMDIDIHFEGGNGQFGDTQYRNPAWDNILHDLVINSDMLPEAHYYEHLNEAIQNREEGCEYLIITPDDSAFLAWADTLKNYRTRQGILTKVVTTTDCGGNEPTDIRNYILNAYENWAIPPAAVLLFGGNQVTNSNFGLKPFILTSPQSWNETYRYPTDNPFSDMNDDSIPDLALSRLTVYNAVDCQQQVEKVIEYELTPPTDTHYYDHPVINSGYQDSKWFAITAQVANNFFRDKLGMHPSNIYMKYTLEDHDPTPPDSIWSIAPNTSAVLDYFGPNGAQYIPSSIASLDEWIDMEDKLPFQNAVNEGSFITFYRDHSNPDWWPCSEIHSTDVPSFHNERPTFLFSIGCSTNNFWNNWSYNGCIADLFLKAKAGAIGSLGANSVTYSQYNDLVTWGMFDYLWPNFMPTLGSQTEPEFSYPSYALVAGKLFLRYQAFLPYSMDAEKIDKTLNLFSFLGDTYLNLYTEVPQPLTVDAPLYHADNHWQYAFTAEEDATVCLSRNGDIICVTQATGQPQSLSIPQMEVGEHFTFTATKQNHFRFERTVTVVSAHQPFIYLNGTNTNDQDGNGQLDYGEYAEIDIIISNASPITSSDGEVTLQCDSPYIEILQGSAHFSQMEPDSSLLIENAFRIKLANNVPDQTVIPFDIHISEGASTQDNHFSITANAPLIKIDPELRPMTAVGGPSTHISTEGKSYLGYSVNNIGHSPISFISANLDIKAPFVSTSDYQCYEELKPNEKLLITHELNTTPNDITGAWLQSRLDIQYGEYHTSLDTIIQYGGVFENFETETLNPLFRWGGHWNYCDEDAYEGNRCYISPTEQSVFQGQLIAPTVTHHCKVSFQYKTHDEEQQTFSFKFMFDNETYLSSEEWQYAEFEPENVQNTFRFTHYYNGSSNQSKIDNICFPPMHTTIAYAGNEQTICSESSIELQNAYAYDCDSIRWTTNGDGAFEDATIANAIYIPGDQDLSNGDVTLTLSAFGDNIIASSTLIHFVDEISMGAIVGDSVVNKYSNPVSHYAIENQEGVRYQWQLEPTEAGIIYDHGNAIDIVWNQHEGNAEVVLSVKADNGCDMEPATKTISLIGYDIPEWRIVNFDLYPNPTDEKVNLVVGETLQGKAVVEVYNLLGERMMTKKVGQLRKGETISLDLSSLVSGLYIIKLCTENGSCTKKVSVR